MRRRGLFGVNSHLLGNAAHRFLYFNASPTHPTYASESISSLSHLLAGARDTVGVELQLPPLSSIVCGGNDEMQRLLRRVVATVDALLHECAHASISLDYMVLRCGDAGEISSLTDTESQFALCFMREVVTRVLSMIPVTIALPLEKLQGLQETYICGFFETLHRMDCANMQLEIPITTAQGGLPRLESTVFNWQQLLEKSRNVDHASPTSQLLSWMVREGFLERFHVGLRVDVHASMQSFFGLKCTEKEKKVPFPEKSAFHREDSSSASPLIKRQCEEGRPITPKELPPTQYPLKKVQTVISAASDTLTLEAPPADFAEMLRASHEAFTSSVSGSKDTMHEQHMLAEFVQQMVSECQSDKGTSSTSGSPTMMTTTKPISTETTGVRRTTTLGEADASALSTSTSASACDATGSEEELDQDGLSAYRASLSDLVQQTGAQYLCASPCVCPDSIISWRRAVRASHVQRLATLPFVTSVLPMLRPAQLGHICRSVHSLNFLSTVLSRELSTALAATPPSLFQAEWDGFSGRIRPCRGETQIRSDGGHVHLLCEEKGEVDVIGNGMARRIAATASFSTDQRARLRELEENFCNGTMRQALEAMLQCDYGASRHILFSVPRDTELDTLLDSLKLCA